VLFGLFVWLLKTWTNREKEWQKLLQQMQDVAQMRGVKCALYPDGRVYPCVQAARAFGDKVLLGHIMKLKSRGLPMNPQLHVQWDRNSQCRRCRRKIVCGCICTPIHAYHGRIPAIEVCMMDTLL